MLEMQVVGIAVDPRAGSAILFLQDAAERTLPIWIGMAEATSIAKELEDLDFPRPLAHDLLRDAIEALGATVREVAVVDLRENTFYAEVVLEDASGRVHRLDARPSDAIALAVRVHAPIYVHEQVLRKANPGAKEFVPLTDKEGWKRLLERMAPEDFGKYKM